MRHRFDRIILSFLVPIACADGGAPRGAGGFDASAAHAPDPDDGGTSGGSGELTTSGDPEASGDLDDSGGSESSGTPDVMSVCGDGVIAGAAETCDDGPQNGDYGRCNESCTGPGPRCGDGLVSGPEACDDGDLDDLDDCTSQCVSATCGDGVVQAATEACDDGSNGDPDDGCTDTCQLPGCGDGLVQGSLAEVCDDGNAVAEDGCEPDCTTTTKTVFITSQKLAGDFGGVLTADQFCQSAADFADLPGTYLAWLSDGNLRPASRFSASVHPYTLTDGSVVADDLIDLLDGVLDHAINVDEFGLIAPESARAWTGVKADGYSSVTHCEKWTAIKGGQWPANLYGVVGEAWQTTDDWSAGTQGLCSSPQSLYCFEQ